MGLGFRCFKVPGCRFVATKREDMMLFRRGTFNVYQGLAISLILHASIALPFIFNNWHTPDQNKHSKLRIDLLGMVANRQVEEKKKQQAPTPPRQVKKTRQKPDTYKTVLTESPVQVAKAEDKPILDEQPEQMPAPVAPAVGSAETQQRQQTIRSAAELEAARIREYLARLAKQLRRNLIYPEEVRRNGVEGISTIAFHITSSGELIESSLRVHKSSGYPALDASALKSVRVSAPFEKPPKELNVSIAMSFNVKN